jgi:hypothetical protein
MEINRNQYFMIGLVLLFLGIQVKCVESFVLTEKAATFVAKRMNKKESQTARPVMQSFYAMTGGAANPQRRSFEPPTWLGWALISVGAVLVLHSLAMNKPGGGG